MANWRMVILLGLPLLTAMRDPFQPPEDPCTSLRLMQWRYQGYVGNGIRSIGIVRNPSGKWLRLSVGEVLPVNGKVARLEPEYLDIDSGAECQPEFRMWYQEGTKNDAMDTADRGANPLPRRGKGKNNHPDRG